jgi:hypothetical protein
MCGLWLSAWVPRDWVCGFELEQTGPLLGVTGGLGVAGVLEDTYPNAHQHGGNVVIGQNEHNGCSGSYASVISILRGRVAKLDQTDSTDVVLYIILHCSLLSALF